MTLLSALNHAKAMFQLRAITAIITEGQPTMTRHKLDGDAIAADRHYGDAPPDSAGELDALVAEIEVFINEPPRMFGDDEPWQVRDYRHALYRVWSEYVTALRAKGVR